MRFYGRPRSRNIWLIFLLTLFLIVPAFGLGQLRAAASSSTSNHISQNPKNSQALISSSLLQTPAKQKSSAISSTAAPATSAPLTFHGGPIQHTQNIYAIFWLPAGDHFEPTGSDTGFESLISRYFNDVGGSNLSKLMVQYPDNINASPTTTVSFGGGFVDTTPYPHAGTTAAPLLGQDITNEIQKIISSGSLPTGINDIYYIFTANGINSCEDQAMTICTFATAQQPS